MQSAKQINERKQRQQLKHLEALRAYVEAGKPCDMRYAPPHHLVHDGPTTLSVELDREALLRFLPLVSDHIIGSRRNSRCLPSRQQPARYGDPNLRSNIVAPQATELDPL